MGAPVILCGKTEAIGTTVIEALRPEFNGNDLLPIFIITVTLTNFPQVIHFIMTPQAGVAQIRAILKGDKSAGADSELGSKDYSKPPVAIILGGGYTDADVELMFKASAGIRPIPWLRPGRGKLNYCHAQPEKQHEQHEQHVINHMERNPNVNIFIQYSNRL